MRTYLKNLSISLAFYDKFAIIQRDIFRKQQYCFFKKRNISQLFSASDWKKFGGVVKTAFYVSRGKKFHHFGKIFRQGCQNCILRVQTNILGFSKDFGTSEQILANIVFSVNEIGKHRVKK